MSQPESKIVIAIPARYASSRFPGKPLALLAGKPMLAHVIEHCLRVPGVDEVVVAGDDNRILSLAERSGAIAIATGPADSGSDRIASALAQRRDISIVVNVQGDEPMLDPAVIAELIEPFTDPSVLVTTAARQFGRNENADDPNRVKVVTDIQGNALYFSRARIPADTPDTGLYLHMGLYAYRYETLMRFTTLVPSPLEQAERLEQLRLLEHGIPVRVVPVNWRGLGVDTPADLAVVEEHLKADTI